MITGIVGADAQRGRWLAGLALSVSAGEGTFEQPEAGHRGTIESNMTGVNPYLRFEASERLSTWGLLGFGTGEMTITEAARGGRGETVTRTGIEMRLAAVGARGALLDAAASGGFDLAVKADAFLVETEWEKVSNERDTQAAASRLRLALEGSRVFELSGSAKLTPGLEFGLRHDGGDAETGTGVEVGGSLRYADAASGLSVEARGRTLIAHEAAGSRSASACSQIQLACMFPDDATAERCQLDKGETGFAFTGRLREAGIRISMDGRGRCLDNIFIERLWRSLKYEAVYLRELADGFEARRVIGEWIDFYNTERPHSALGGNAGRGLPRRPACGYDGQGA